MFFLENLAGFNVFYVNCRDLSLQVWFKSFQFNIDSTMANYHCETFLSTFNLFFYEVKSAQERLSYPRTISPEPFFMLLDFYLILIII